MKHLRASSVRSSAIGVESILMKSALLIWVLLFLLGIEVGSNPRIISGLQTLGLEAIVLTFGGSLGSVGRPISCIQVKIGEDNEVLLKGPTITPGYYHRYPSGNEW